MLLGLSALTSCIMVVATYSAGIAKPEAIPPFSYKTSPSTVIQGRSFQSLAPRKRAHSRTADAPATNTKEPYGNAPICRRPLHYVFCFSNIHGKRLPGEIYPPKNIILLLCQDIDNFLSYHHMQPKAVITL